MTDEKELFEKFKRELFEQEFNKKIKKLAFHKQSLDSMRARDSELHWRTLTRRAIKDLITNCNITSKAEIIEQLKIDIPNTKTQLLQSVLDKMVKDGDLETDGNEYEIPSCLCSPNTKQVIEEIE